MQNKKEQRVTDDIERVWSKEMSEQDKTHESTDILKTPLLQYEPKVPEESLIDGLASTKDRIIIAGGAGEGKTVKIQCLAVQAAKGVPVWNRLAVSRPLRVALIEEELTGERPKQIVEQLIESIGDILQDNLYLFRDTVVYGDKVVETHFEITNDDRMKKLTDALIEYHPDIIILDGWYKFVAGQERDDIIVQKALNWMDFIVNATSASILVICHTRKQLLGVGVSESTFDKISGKGLYRWGRTKLILQRMSDDDLYSKLYGSSSNPAWGDLCYLLYWNPETWVTNVVSKEDAPYGLWKKVYPQESQAETRDVLLRAKACGLTDKKIGDIVGVTDRMIRYYRTGHSSMDAEKMAKLLNHVKALGK